MQISKCFLTVCLAVSVFSVRAGDNDAQTKAREALEKKLNDLKGQAPQTVTPQAAPVVKTPAPPPAAAPAPAAAAQPVAAQAPADDASIAKAREAMEKKMNEMHGTPPPAAAAAPVAAQPKPQATQAPPPTTPAPVTPPPQSTTFSPVPAADPQAIAKARDAMREKMQSLEAQPPTAPAAPTVTPAPATLPPAAPAVAVTPIEPPTTPGINGPPGADSASMTKAFEAERMAMASMPPEASSTAKPGALNFPPLQGPPLGISTEKEGHLRALLQQYKMDLISPEQYQAARAKILAGP